jgi:hypothetical protein
VIAVHAAAPVERWLAANPVPVPAAAPVRPVYAPRHRGRPDPVETARVGAQAASEPPPAAVVG